MTSEEFLAKWTAEAEAMHRRGARVNGAGLCSEILADFRSVVASHPDPDVTFNLTQAASYSGYSREHLGRLVKAGKICNAGRPCAPRIRRGDLPRKLGILSREATSPHIP